MKCPKCGFITSDLKKQCMRCGIALPGKGEPPAASPAPPVAAPAPPSAPAIAASVREVPEWRKQVTQKVLEYGERKKLLITPPGPLKETATVEAAPVDLPEPAPVAPEPVRPPRRIIADPEPEPLPPDPVPDDVSGIPPVEVSVQDLWDFEEDDETEPETFAAQPPLLLGRRLGSLLVDSTILIVLHTALVYLVSQIISQPFEDLIRMARVPLVCIFLLFHFVYYSYFYKTSRQTPGQVFFGIELRDPLSSRISLNRIAVRWLCLVVLNVINLLPLLAGKPMLLDQLSKTEIRTLR